MLRTYRTLLRGGASTAVLTLGCLSAGGCGPTYQVNETIITQTQRASEVPAGEDPHAGVPAGERAQPGAGEEAGQVRGGVLHLGALSMRVPETWSQKPNPSTMRLATFQLPPAAGDKEAAELAIFAKIGGTIEMNLRRWEGQFTLEGGKSATDAAKITKERSHGLEITFIDLSGTYHKPRDPATMMSGDTIEAPHYRLLGAIVVGADAQPVYFKTTGPEKTVGAHKEEFLQAIRSMKPSE